MYQILSVYDSRQHTTRLHSGVQVTALHAIRVYSSSTATCQKLRMQIAIVAMRVPLHTIAYHCSLAAAAQTRPHAWRLYLATIGSGPDLPRTCDEMLCDEMLCDEMFCGGGAMRGVCYARLQLCSSRPGLPCPAKPCQALPCQAPGCVLSPLPQDSCVVRCRSRRPGLRQSTWRPAPTTASRPCPRRRGRWPMSAGGY